MTQRFTTYKLGPRGSNPIYLELVEDREGALWLGTEFSGLQRFDPATGKVEIYRHDINRPRTLSDDRVNSVYFDHSGTMWVGTQNGLNKLDPRSGTFTVYTRRNGLPGNAVACVLDDDRGNLWMSTNNGVARFDPQRRTFSNYSTTDGLSGPNLTGWGACFKSPTGEMFFGGFSGATAFFPDEVSYDSYIPPIVLTDFRLFGNPVEIGSRSPLQRSISYARDLILTHEQNVFSLSFAALSYTNPATNRYRYKLEPLERNWNEAGSDGRQATYTTLPAGKYTLRVQGATSTGAWSEPGASVRIEILPPFWGTWWFQSACGIFILVSLWFAHGFRLQQIARQFNVRLDERIGERNRIARELHDSLLQGIQGLMWRFHAAAAQIPVGEPARHLMESALDRADEVIVEARDRVKGLRTAEEHRDLSETFAIMSAELAQEHAIPFQITLQGTPRDLNRIVCDDACQIGREALINAFRHSLGQKIETEITFARTELRLRFRDDGCGVDSKILERDGAGEYLANYSRTDSNTVTKQKVKYVRTDGTPGKEGVQIQIDQSESRFVLDSDGGAVTEDARIRVRIGVASGDANQLTIVTETHLAGLRKRQAQETIGSLARALSAVESSPVRNATTRPRAVTRSPRRATARRTQHGIATRSRPHRFGEVYRRSNVAGASGSVIPATSGGAAGCA